MSSHVPSYDAEQYHYDYIPNGPPVDDEEEEPSDEEQDEKSVEKSSEKESPEGAGPHKLRVGHKRPAYADSKEASVMGRDMDDSSRSPATALAELFDVLDVPDKERVLICRGYASYLASSLRAEKATRNLDTRRRKLNFF